MCGGGPASRMLTASTISYAPPVCSAPTRGVIKSAISQNRFDEPGGTTVQRCVLMMGDEFTPAARPIHPPQVGDLQTDAGAVLRGSSCDAATKTIAGVTRVMQR